jgi:hypothetical protein
LFYAEPEVMPTGAPSDCGPPDANTQPVPGQPTSVGFRGEGDVVVQMREPAGLYFAIDGEKLLFPADTARDVGHNLFHLAPNTMGSLACASCHPEGLHDGRTWNFSPIGPRRTQTLGGGILSTAPLHWDGDLGNMNNLMSEVFGRRMGGAVPGPLPMAKLERWVDSIPALPRSLPQDPDAVKRGEALFQGMEGPTEGVGCVTCHSGPKYTDNKTTDVGTGEPLQVPHLMGLADRAPYMHDGCAATLKDRFGPCGGGDAHSRTSHLSEQQISDLVAFLETL